MTLTAFVLGSGFAGQGHAAALRDCGVEVVGMASRTASVVERVAGELDIPYWTTDWQQGLTETKPDIVAVGTPGGAHVEPIHAALDLGMHVFCDKPLAPTAVEARRLHEHALRAGAKAGVKTAYAASYRYMPCVELARELVAQGAIGVPWEVEAISHFGLDPLIPFGWSHTLAQGGGRLNNNFTHKLSIVLHVLGVESSGGGITRVCGTTRGDLKQAPVVQGVHDFRERRKFAPSSADNPGLVWTPSDADWSYTVQAEIETGKATNSTTTKTTATSKTESVSALFKHAGLQHRFHPDHLTFFGSQGAIHIEGHYGQGPLSLRKPGQDWEVIPLPDSIRNRQPDIADDTLRNWTILARHFVNDIRGQTVEPYPTFRDGWIYQAVIDAVRAGDGWMAISELDGV